MTGPESVPICQSLSWWKIMQTAESLAIKGVQRVFLRSCTELSTAHGDSCRGVEEFSHRVLMESRGKRLAWQGIGLPNAAGSLFMVANTGPLSLRRALPTRRQPSDV